MRPYARLRGAGHDGRGVEGDHLLLVAGDDVDGDPAAGAADQRLAVRTIVPRRILGYAQLSAALAFGGGFCGRALAAAGA